MAGNSIPTHPAVALEWRTGYQHRGDDPLASAARSSVVIITTQAVAA